MDMVAHNNIFFLYYSREAFKRDNHFNNVNDILSKCVWNYGLCSRTLIEELLKLISIIKSRRQQIDLSEYLIIEFDHSSNKINNVFEADNIIDKDLLETYI